MSKVIILRASESSAYRSVNKIFRLSGGINKFVKKGEIVLIKPNFLCPKHSSTGATTNLEVIESVIKIVKKQGGIPVIAEGGPLSFDTEQTFRRLRVDNLAKKHKVKLIDLNKDKTKLLKVKNPLGLKKISVARTILEADKIINIPVMKTHALTIVSLGMKNLMGCIPAKEKILFHTRGVEECVVDLCGLIKPCYTIIDGIIGMEGVGPSNGKPKRMNLLLGSEDLLALEIITSKVMGFNPKKLKMIKLGEKKGLGEYDEEKITVIGLSIDKAKSKFSFPLITPARIFSSLILGRTVRIISKTGINTNKLAIRLYELIRPYPYFLNNCVKCNRCVNNCPAKALSIKNDDKPLLEKKKCIKCYVCDEVCLYGSVKIRGRR